MGTFTRVIVIWLHFSRNYYELVSLHVTVLPSITKLYNLNRQSTPLNYFFLPKSNIDLCKLFFSCFEKRYHLSNSRMRKKRKRKKQEKKPKSDVNPLNKINQLIGIKNSVNCNTITRTYNLHIYLYRASWNSCFPPE